MAFEYTPEITQGYLDELNRPIMQRGAQQVGQARGEALRRGLTGDPFEALKVGEAQNSMNTNLASTNANLRYGIAGLQREERMGTENFNKESTFKSGEAQKDRDSQERMANIQREYQAAFQRAQERSQKRSFWPNLIASTVATGAGFALGGPLGAAAAAYKATHTH